MPTTPATRPTWDEVIRPLADSALWVHIRRAATLVAEAHLAAMGDTDSGISSSDINHTIYGVAAWIDRTDADTYPGRVLSRLVDDLA